jgi:hypothetical protein
MMNLDEMYATALVNRQTREPVDVMRDGSERLNLPEGRETVEQTAPGEITHTYTRQPDGTMRIDIAGVGDEARDQQVTAPPDGVRPPTAAGLSPGTPEFAQDMVEQMFAGGYPEGAAPMSARRFIETAADVPAGIAKGAVQGTLGFPGDVVAIGRGVAAAVNPQQGETRLDAFIRAIGDPVEAFGYNITTEGMKKLLEGALGPLVPEGSDPRRVEAAKTAETVGEIGAMGQLATQTARGAAQGVRAIGQEIATTRPTGAITLAQDAVPFVMTGADAQRIDSVRKVVDQGITQNMSATKILQAVEAQTGQKTTGKQATEIKQYIADKTPKGQIYSDQAFKDLVAQPFPMEPSTANFTKSFNDAMQFLGTLDANGLRVAAQDADTLLAPILGVSKEGKVNRLLTTNGKLLKTEKGLEGKKPIELPDGRNIESAGLAISPAFKAGKFSTCPNSASCAQECLGKTSGGYFAYGGGADLEAMKGTRLRSFRMTQAMFRQPEAFAIKIHNEIISLKNAAAQEGNALAIRLNVLSDIDPKVHEAIIKAHPDVFFYDYTKMKYKPIAPNHHYTYSSTGTSQRAGINGMTVDVENQHTNWDQMKSRLDGGDNVAMAFSGKKALPESVFDEATGKVYTVIDGDAYDFRPMDKQPPGRDGVIIGLKNKAMTRKETTAVQDSKGFFVPYDPQFLKDGKKLARDQFGDLIPTNTQVVIPQQKRRVIDIQVEGRAETKTPTFKMPSFARLRPETSEDIDKIYDYLEERAKKSGYKIETGSSNVSGSRYLTIIEELPDDDARSIELRVSNHGDRYSHTYADEKLSIDPSRGGVDLEDALYQLQEKGYNLIDG